MMEQQQRKSKWTDRGPFHVEGGWSYSEACKQQIDGRLMRSLGLDDIDDLFEMKAPVFHQQIKTLAHNVDVICQYCQYFSKELQKQQETLNQISEQIKEIKALQQQSTSSSSFSR